MVLRRRVRFFVNNLICVDVSFVNVKNLEVSVSQNFINLGLFCL